MSPLGVEFEDQNEQYHNLMMRHIQKKEEAGMIYSLVKTGIVKNEKGASMLLCIIAGIFILVSLVLLKLYVFKGEKENYFLSDEVIRKLPIEVQLKIRNN